MGKDQFDILQLNDSNLTISIKDNKHKLIPCNRLE